MPLSRAILDAEPESSGLTIPKCPAGTTASMDAIDWDKAIARNWERVKKFIVDRDKGRCRMCGRRCSYGARRLADKADPHHILFASAGGEDSSANVLLLCRTHHDEIHVLKKWYLSGDADALDEMDRGMVKVERQVEGGFETVGWI